MCLCLRQTRHYFCLFFSAFFFFAAFLFFIVYFILNITFCVHSVLFCSSHCVSFKICRYKSLHDPLQERRGSLEASRLQYQFFRDVDEELAWVREKLPMASSRDYGQSLATVQSLQEKHKVMSFSFFRIKENMQFSLPQEKCSALGSRIRDARDNSYACLIITFFFSKDMFMV